MTPLWSILILFSFNIAYAVDTSDFELIGKTKGFSLESYSQYCSNGRQIKDLREVFSIKVLEPSKGIPVDEYQKILIQRKQDAVKVAKELFLYHPTEKGESSYSELLIRNEKLKNLKVFKGNKEVDFAWFDFPAMQDLENLRKNFVLTIPKEQQRDLFQGMPSQYFRSMCINSKEIIGEVGYISLGDDCKFSPSNAIASRLRGFEVYALRFTNFKQATGKEPNVINFDVSLDLNVFCSYNIPLKELYSK